jgi:hypothetical protein
VWTRGGDPWVALGVGVVALAPTNQHISPPGPCIVGVTLAVTLGAGALASHPVRSPLGRGLPTRHDPPLGLAPTNQRTSPPGPYIVGLTLAVNLGAVGLGASSHRRNSRHQMILHFESNDTGCSLVDTRLSQPAILQSLFDSIEHIHHLARAIRAK